MSGPVQDDKALLQRLCHEAVEFVIIGGFCGILHGVSLVTRDLDCCCPFTLANLRRIEAAVKDLHPFHRLTPNKLPFELTDELTGRLRNLYLQTDLGKVDFLSEVKGIGSYEAVLSRTISCSVPYGQLRMLDIDALIISKEAVGREHDLAAVRQLRAIKERQERS